jgi:outer membrane receptor protein involved in Fe transport
VCFAIFFSPLVHAQSSSGLDELLGQAIVSTPSKDSETDTTAPATSSVITADDLKRFGIRSLDEALNYLSLGMATSSSQHAAEIGARGVLIHGDYGNHVLLLVDGHIQNEPWNGTAYFERGAGVPFEMVDHIEVVLGPGSVMYGSEAMLGVINIVTKRAKDFSGPRVIVEADGALPPGKSNGPTSPGLFRELGVGYRLGVGYGSEFTIGGSPSEVTLGADYYENHGPVWQLGPQAYGDDYVTLAPKNFGPRATPGTWGGLLRHADSIEAPSAYLRFSTGAFRAALRASVFRRSTAFPDSLAADTGDFDDPFNHEVDRFLNLDLSQRFVISPRVELVARTYGDLYDYKWYNRTSAAEDCPNTFLNGCVRRLHGIGRSLGGELRAELQWPILRASTMLGMDVQVHDVSDNLQIEGNAGAGSAPANGGHWHNGLLAPYIAQTFSPMRWLDVNLGIRLDHDTRFGEKLSPRTALGVSPWRGGRLKLIYAEAFRAPSVYEQTYSDPAAQIASGGLGPETVRSIETSFEQRFGKHRIMYGVFRSWWDGLVGATLLTPDELTAAIARGELSAGLAEGFRRSNLGRIDNYGMNAGYDGAAIEGRLRFGINVTIARSRIDMGDGSGSLPLVVAPSAFGNARISYELGGAFPTIAAALRFAGRRLADRAYDGGFSPTPSAQPLLAVRLAANGKVSPLPGLSYRVGIEYSFAKVEPYVVGANLYANDNVSRAELAPIRRAQAFVGLEYSFDESRLKADR